MVGYCYCFHTDVHAEFLAMAIVYTIGGRVQSWVVTLVANLKIH